MNKQRTDLHILVAEITTEDNSKLTLTVPVFLDDADNSYTQEVAIDGSAYDIEISFNEHKKPTGAKIYEYDSNDLLYQAEIISFFPIPVKDSHSVGIICGEVLLNQLNECNDLKETTPEKLETDCPDIHNLLERKFSTAQEADAYRTGLSDALGWEECYDDNVNPNIPEWAWKKYGKPED